MIIINEDTLIHTDSSSDVIEHFGVKGMRWGQRRVISNRGAAKAQKNISYKDALKEVRKPIYGEAYKSQERYEISKEKYGKKDPRTKRDKAVWDSNRALASYTDQIRKSGHYAHERTITNGYINNLYDQGVRSSQKAKRFNEIAKQAGLKG